MHETRPFLQKLDAGFCTYGFVSLLAPIGQKLVLRPQTTKTEFLQYEKYFLENPTKFCIK